MLSLNNLIMRSRPYPVGSATDILDPFYYDALVSSYPSEAVFTRMGNGYNKFALSERCNPEEYHAFLGVCPEWKAFHEYIKKQQFLDDVFSRLADIGLRFPAEKYSARFEFSSLPLAGGMIAPHTDIPSKVVTIVVPLVQEGRWPSDWGGGTDILRQLDPTKKLADYQAPLSEFEKVTTYKYRPNRCVLFIKGDNSWHSVGPMTGPSAAIMRRTATINIEKSA